MVTIKNPVRSGSISFLTFMAVLLTGCAPPGARALIQGKRLLDQGRYAQAVQEMRTATALLATNAQAWNYLGLACHQAGQGLEAEKAYRHALALDHDLTEAHFNLGCLWLEQNKADAAKTEFFAYTLRRPNQTAGFVKLGAAQLRNAQLEPAGAPRLRELNAAEKSFNDALRLSPQSPEGLNGLGLVRVQRGRGAEAAQFFTRALNQQPAYQPALLNLAIVAQEYLHDPQIALQKYREYLSLTPASGNAGAVRAAIRELEQELRHSAHPVSSNAPANAGASPTPTSNLMRLSNAQALQPAAVARNDWPLGRTNAPKPASLAPAPRGVEVVTLTSEPPLNPVQDLPPAQGRTPFSEPRQTQAPTVVSQPTSSRYEYHSLPKAAPGNRAQAEISFAQGARAQASRRLPEAIQFYRLATQQEPTYYEAYYNLGLAAFEAGDLPVALRACETAVDLRPSSVDARYNFALALKQANFVADAVNELERLLVDYPNEPRAHLALGNLYAQQLHQPTRARAHYSKVLEADPSHPQAAQIRYWMNDNPKE